MRFIKAVCTAFALIALLACPAFAGEASVSGALVEVLHNKGVIDDASYNGLKKAASEGEQSVDKMLIEVLHNKGIIDDASYRQLAEQAVKPVVAAAPVAPQSSPAEANRPIEKVLAGIEEGFARAGGDTVKLKIGTWFQGGFVSDANGSNTGSIPGFVALNPNSGSTFFTRFARLYFNAAVADKAGMRITLDGASSNLLQDAFIWADYIPYTRITLGQFLTPFGDETWRAPFEVPVINYAFASTMLQSVNFRDVGAMATVKYSTKIAGMPFGGAIQTAVINGAGRNNPDNNDSKDWVGRAWVNPFVPGLTVGGSWYIGKADYARTVTIVQPPQTPPLPDIVRHFVDKQDIQRWGAEFDYAPTFAKGLALRGEYLSQRQFFNSGFQANPNASLAPFDKLKVPDPKDSTKTIDTPVFKALGVTPRYFHSAGWYVSALYRVNGLTGIAKYLNDLEPVFRYEEFNEDLSVGDKNRTRATYGLNYWLNKYTRLMANFEVIRAEDGLGAPDKLHPDRFTIYPKGIETNDHEVFTLNYQIWF